MSHLHQAVTIGAGSRAGAARAVGAGTSSYSSGSEPEPGGLRLPPATGTGGATTTHYTRSSIGAGSSLDGADSTDFIVPSPPPHATDGVGLGAGGGTAGAAPGMVARLLGRGGGGYARAPASDAAAGAHHTGAIAMSPPGPHAGKSAL
eukprot:CAMPEP_0202858978 /NCGR_PEP_ID=MMETSP1391-20130828/1289_1 /ASSEMBLY_ACC=CAM_ASM_000867 /TAXON_ID=1034604 /ORGANISM="Chlamydomonas leiostraca, Strain SAG 11-49" /LENGTH=147 /DNA_ID=CAMNT_0049537969 /DNA_START=27 /DNA_END=470 /DNA_ORIENTATION=+